MKKPEFSSEVIRYKFPDNVHTFGDLYDQTLTYSLFLQKQHIPMAQSWNMALENVFSHYRTLITEKLEQTRGSFLKMMNEIHTRQIPSRVTKNNPQPDVISQGALERYKQEQTTFNLLHRDDY